MSTLTKDSTDAQVDAAYDDNISYFEDNSVAKARALVTAIGFLLRRTPTTAQEANSMVQMDPKILQAELNTAKDFLATNDVDRNSSITLSSNRNFRR